MGVRTCVALAVGLSLSGCSSLPPEQQPKPYSLKYAKNTLVALKYTWIISNATSVRDARIGKFEQKLLGSSVCVAYDWRDPSGNYTGIKPYIVYISPDHYVIVQVLPPDSSHPCDPNELDPFPELNGPTAKAAPPPRQVGARPPGRGPKLK